MNTPVRSRISAALLFAFTSALLPWAASSPSPAHAQNRAAAAPVIEGLEVNADAGLAPGSTLEFTLRGTPNAIARVQVTGSSVSLPLTESRPGLYTGMHIVRNTERGLAPKSLIRADLTASGRTTTANFSFPPSFAAQQAATAPQPPLVTPQPPVVSTQPAAPRVDRFVLAPVDRLEPGAELKFTLDGTPGAQASIQIPGLPLTVPMQETRPGHYIANYTLRKVDTVGPGPVVATLRSGERVVTLPLSTPLPVVAATPAPTSMGAAAAGPMVLQITSPGPNAVVDASQLVLQGRTAPGASVHVKVDAVPPVAPGRLAVAQSVTQQTLQADANGNFSLNFGPQRYAPGTRFEVQLTAKDGAQAAAEQRLTLFQRQG